MAKSRTGGKRENDPAGEARRQIVSAAVDAQVAVNQRAAQWSEYYAEHRRRVTTLLAELAPAGGTGRLCLLGAGNCHDVDLDVLAAGYREIHLADLDRRALEGALERQTPLVREKIALHGRVDLGGALDRLHAWRKAPPGPPELAALVDSAGVLGREKIGTGFDVAASCCVTTQISHGLTSTLGKSHPHLPAIRQAALTFHLRLLASLIAPGGRGVFLSDVVANDTYPLDDLPPDRDLKEVLSDLTRAGNCFFGGDPLRISQTMFSDPLLTFEANSSRRLEPWLWRANAATTYLVYGFVFDRRQNG